MTTEKRAAWNTWKLQQLDETSGKELEGLGQDPGAPGRCDRPDAPGGARSEEDMDNFDYEYGFREERG